LALATPLLKVHKLEFCQIKFGKNYSMDISLQLSGKTSPKLDSNSSSMLLEYGRLSLYAGGY